MNTARRAIADSLGLGGLATNLCYRAGIVTADDRFRWRDHVDGLVICWAQSNQVKLDENLIIRDSWDWDVLRNAFEQSEGIETTIKVNVVGTLLPALSLFSLMIRLGDHAPRPVVTSFLVHSNMRDYSRQSLIIF
ncbi:hypothetical protein B0J13DRAFT_522352 [Dactylonectria estremocensis]|uniref:Uncharacterized protein n=1 Tax=Dactylonectria estremocensis TaxID=1079267 RepID=A0A9P9J797_9HYPO|nr:hypothetical protein B0J13DRAFT_522352 [Dactylonectria estremocensis]